MRDAENEHSNELYNVREESLGTLYHITLSKAIEDGSLNYAEVIDTLEQACPEDQVRIYLDCYGGSTYTSCALVGAMNACKAPITAVIRSRCYSAACDIALSADWMEMKPHTFLMFHNYSSESSGKGNELMSRVKNEHRVEVKMIKNLYTPFLTDEEIRAILNDKDIYIHWDDTDIQDRIHRHYGRRL